MQSVECKLERRLVCAFLICVVTPRVNDLKYNIINII